ncbi:MAG: hypothetical protein JNK32_01820 [Anaerolineales bacterium]|nr:hypothetical protein [Anaerolineales bacterium]
MVNKQKPIHQEVEVTLVIPENAGHNFKPVGGVLNPSRMEIFSLMGDFFDSMLF